MLFDYQRIIIVGDIHSCSTELFELLGKANYSPANDLLVSTGDLFDRGPDPWGIYEFFSRSERRLAVMGNHESKHARGLLSNSQKMTRFQLGKNYPEVVEWMKSLPLWLNLPEALVIHAAIIPNIPLVEQDRQIILGHMSGATKLKQYYPNGEWWKDYSAEKPIVFGHEKQQSIELVTGLVYALEEDCAFSGYLHGLILPSKEIISVKSKQNYAALLNFDFLNETFPYLLETRWSKINKVLQVLDGEPKSQVINWLAEFEPLFKKIASKITREGNQLFTGISEEERLDAWKKVEKNPARQLLMLYFTKRKMTKEMIMARLKTPKKIMEICEALSIPFSKKKLLKTDD
ncbi:MAG: hypothetical protein GF308_12200 [Candidatus Heimdallarchaeota archaeon]|nr:hypothetical protein [Candidatus Heimdallarchaeota archaeon]